MSIDWPVKSEDLDEVIANLEKELNEKVIEIKQKNELISELKINLEKHKDEVLLFLLDKGVSYPSEI
ncbi:MAG: hypothetical protein ACFFBZ_13890, partial [Promethearchaeota archaeon]